MLFIYMYKNNTCKVEKSIQEYILIKFSYGNLVIMEGKLIKVEPAVWRKIYEYFQVHSYDKNATFSNNVYP